MAVVDNSIGSGTALPANKSGEEFTLKYRIDAATTNVTSGDVLKLWMIPADTFVKDVICIVRTEEGGTLTIDIGDYTDSTDVAIDADGFGDGIDGNSAAASHSLGSDIAYGGGGGANTYGKIYTDNLAYIGVLFNNAADTAVIDVIAVCTKLEPNVITNTY